MKAWKEITRILLLVAGCVVLYMLLQHSNILSSEGYAPATMRAPAPAPAPLPLTLRDVDLRRPTLDEKETVKAALRNLPPASLSPAAAVQPVNSFSSAGESAPAEFEPMAPAASDLKIAKVDIKPSSKQTATFCNDPKDCWPQQQLTADDLLPKDTYGKWAELHPEGQGSLKDRSFLEAGYLSGMTQVTKNANYGLRSEPPVPRFNVGPWLNSTIEQQDHMRKALDSADW